jgi:transposase-like protein
LYLSPTRNTAAAKRFLGKALTGLKDWEKPSVINTDKAPTYAAAPAELKTEGRCPADTLHRQVKYLNNVIEADHGKLKQLTFSEVVARRSTNWDFWEAAHSMPALHCLAR